MKAEARFVGGIVMILGFLISFIPSGPSMAEPLSRYPWVIKSSMALCSLFPKERSMSVEGKLILDKVASYSEILQFDIPQANLKLKDALGQNIPYKYVEGGGICPTNPLPLGLNTIQFEYQHTFPASDSADPYLFVGEDFTNLDDCWCPTIKLCLTVNGKPSFPAPFMGELAISAPDGYTAIGTGNKVGEKRLAGRVTTYFRTEKPVARQQIFAGKYKTIQGKSAGVSFSINVRKGLDFKRASEMKENVAKILQFYTDRYGFFPSSELHIIQRPYLENGNNFSTSHGLVLINGEDIFIKSPDEVMPSPGSLLAHEIYHQYMGQVIQGTGFDRKLFLEGMTCYSEILCTCSIFGNDLAAKEINVWEIIVRKIPKEIDVAIASLTKECPNVSSYSYYKMPLFYLTLRQCIGDDAMKKFERSLLKKFGYKDKISFNEFLSFLKQETGSLPGAGKIFDAWLNEPGLPPFWKPDMEGGATSVH